MDNTPFLKLLRPAGHTFSLAKRRRWYDDTNPSKPETPPDKSGGNTGGDDQNPAWLPERLKRAEEAARKKMLADLGIEDPDTAKKLLADAKKRADDEKSESQKALEKAEAAAKRAAELEEQLKTERQQRVLDRRDGAIRTKAANAHDVDAVLEWANRAANKALLDKTVNAEGIVDDKAIDALIEACRKGAPHLFKAKSGVGSPSTQGGSTPDADKNAKTRAAQELQHTIRGSF